MRIALLFLVVAIVVLVIWMRARRKRGE